LIKTKPIISIVYLNFNKLEETRKTTKQLLDLTSGLNYIEIIAVDNNSTDGTRQYLKQQTSKIRTLLLNSNTGIAGYNQAFEISQGEIILVLDDDSSPCCQEIFPKLIKTFADNPNIGVIACHIVDSQGGNQSSWQLPKNKEPGLSPAFIGCGFAIRRNLFKKIGWYPGSFFIYENETKIAFEVRKAGYEIFYDPSCLIQHRADLTQRPGWRRIFYPTRNNLWLIRQYYPKPIASYLIISRMAIGLLNSIRLKNLKAYIKGIIEGIKMPVKKSFLDKEQQKKFSAFFQHNSIFHHLLKRR
jgi:GT2 family glycosyltransferase